MIVYSFFYFLSSMVGQAQSEAWMTPVEIFAPYYSHALAKYILRLPDVDAENLRIVEAGGGSGTNALHILNYLQVLPRRSRGSRFTTIGSRCMHPKSIRKLAIRLLKSVL